VEDRKVCLPCTSKLKKCNYCKKFILGEYILFREKNILICKECFLNYPKCKVCQLTIKRWVEVNKEKLCFDCALKVKFCHLCKGIISGRYWFFKEKKLYFCDNCYKESEHCHLCSIPTEKLAQVYGWKICLSCLENLPHCKCCQRPILDRGWQYLRVEGIYCNICHNKREHCDTCGVPLKNDYIKLEDRRLICLPCHHQAIKDSKKAYEILKEVESVIFRKFKIKVNHSSRLNLKNKDELENLQDRREENVLGIFKRVNSSFDIYLLSHLPYSLSVGVLSHEYIHAWQAENTPSKQDLILREGFCEWVSYHVLLELNLKKEAALIGKRKDIYGQGFRFMRKLEKEKGIPYVVEFCKRAYSSSIFCVLA
jgi:hypothetical protein